MDVSTLAGSAGVASTLGALMATSRTTTEADDRTTETRETQASASPAPPPPSSGSGADPEAMFVSLFGDTGETSSSATTTNSTVTLSGEEEIFDLDGDGTLSSMEQAAYDASQGGGAVPQTDETAMTPPPSGSPSSEEERGVATVQSVVESLASTATEDVEAADAQDDMRRVQQFEQLLAESLGGVLQG